MIESDISYRRGVVQGLGCLLFFSALLVVSGLACRQEAPTETLELTALPAFPPGSIATSLARPTQPHITASAIADAPGSFQAGSQPLITVNPTPVPTDMLSTTRDQYYLAARLVLERYQLDVHQVITYTNQTGEPLESIWLVVEADRQVGGFNWRDTSWNHAVVNPWRSSEGTWQIELPASLAPGQAGILETSFDLNLRPDGGVLGYSQRQLNFGDWYVRIPPFRPDVGWLVHQPGAAGEHSVYASADFRVQLDLGDDGRNLVVAASASGHPCGEKLCYEMMASRGFAWSASDEYQVLETEEAGIVLKQYVFPEHTFAGQAAMAVARQAVGIYQAEFGAYPYQSLAMVEADFFDGMEYPGMFFLGEEYYTNYDGSPEGYLTALTAHEIAHQWWFSLVGNDQALEPWLDEALSTYSELIYYQTQYPDLADWWWEFRVKRFLPGGFVDSTVYDHAGFRPYVNAVYLRGAQFLQELRVAMGNEDFFAFLRAYYLAYQGKIATTSGFFLLADQFLEPEKLQAIRQLYFSH